MSEGTWQRRVRGLKRDAYALVLAYRDRRTPWYARLAALGVAAYAFSPIDLIPDFIPVLGLLDDLVLVPLGILLVLRLVPEEVMADCRAQAEDAFASGKPVFRSAAVVVVVLWAASAYLAWRIGGAAVIARGSTARTATHPVTVAISSTAPTPYTSTNLLI